MSVQMALPSGSREPPPEEAEVLVIGGGIMGLSFAYNAARLGQKGIVVVDRSYLCSGASGRNGGGVRMQWSTEDNVRLMQESIDICKRFAAEMGVNVWFRQGGYLFLLKDEKLLPTMESNVVIQNRCGVPTTMLTPKEAQDLVPALNMQGIIAGSFNPRDGVLFPWPFLWGYANRAIELGVKLHTFCEVDSMEMENGRISHVHVGASRPKNTPSNLQNQDQEGSAPRAWTRTIRAKHVINATGAWSPILAKKIGIELPNKPYRHEILTTEPLKAFLNPMVTILGESLYFSQSMRGEIVGGMGDEHEPSSFDQSSSLAFMRRFARAATQLLPALSNVQVVRQWAGLYDISPDGNPLLGEPEGASNMTLLCGFTGRGFMMAPIVGKLCAERLVKGKKVDYFDKNTPDRFRFGIAKDRESMNIG